jgi:hypothetical protein
MRAAFHPASSWVEAVRISSVFARSHGPLMHAINNSNWTWREPDIKVVAWAHIGNGENAMRQIGHPMHTVVTNNSAAHVELFRLHPIEWIRGTSFSSRLFVARLGTGRPVAGLNEFRQMETRFGPIE